MYVQKKMYFHFMSGNFSSNSSMWILLNDFWSVDCPNGMHCAFVNHFIFHFNEMLVYIESMQLHFIICGMVLDFLHITAKWAPHSCKSRERVLCFCQSTSWLMFEHVLDQKCQRNVEMERVATIVMQCSKIRMKL